MIIPKMQMRQLLWAVLLCLLSVNAAAKGGSKSYNLYSPDGKLSVTVQTDGQLRWSILHSGTQVLVESEIGLTVNDGKKEIVMGKEMRVTDAINDSHQSSFNTPFYKKAHVEDHFNRLVIYDKKYGVEFRAYNDGAAYRFIPTTGKMMAVKNEKAEFNFAGDYKAFIPYVNDNRGGERYCFSFESLYDEQALSDMFADSLAITPLAVCLPDGKKAVVMDAGVENYPGMMLLRGKTNGLRADFAPVPTEVEYGGFNMLNVMPVRRSNFIAQIDNRRPVQLPWRAVVVSERDAELLNCDMAQRLAPECRLTDTSWIQPGKVAWDWWNNLNLSGVDFVTGMNTRTYEYYIDFAAENKLEYIIIDEGWSTEESLTENLSPDIDLRHLVDYGNDRDVGIILWASWRNCQNNIDAVFEHYAKMGIKGFKVDFFDRDDQAVIQGAYMLAETAARHHLLLDLHGFKPFGIQRAYPNIVNFEGVKGLENNKWEPRTAEGPLHDFPRYDVTAPYLRMLCGPMDYTPGAMTNATRDCYFGNNDHPMSQGTRAHQVAMYIMYEAPLQMLADSPSKYMREQECTDFISLIPTTFDETIALDGKIGEYAAVARRKGDTWYISAMTNWTARDLTLDLSFLGGGQHRACIISDGVNAAKEATDYRCTDSLPLNSTSPMQIHLAPGGGWAAIVK